MQYDFETYINRSGQGSAKWLEMKKKNPAVSPDIVPLSVADMEFRTAPEIVAGLQEYLGNTVLGYTQATDGYYDAVQGWMLRRHNWKVEREWIVTSPGVVAALGLVVKAFTQQGQGVIIMTPVYYPFYLVVKQTGRRLAENTLININGEYEIDFEGLEKLAKDENNKMLLLCSPHNPVGRVWSRDELERVADICVRNGVLVVADEIHHDLIMPGNKHTVFSLLEKGREAIICTAPSKTFNLAGMQTSNIIISNEELRKRFRQEKRDNAVMELNTLGYKACEIAYTRCEAWLEALLNVLAQNKKMVEEFVLVRLAKIKVSEMQGTYLQWLDMRKYGLSTGELERKMTQDAQAFFDEGYIFGEAGAGFERVNIACPSAMLCGVLERMEAVL